MELDTTRFFIWVFRMIILIFTLVILSTFILMVGDASMNLGSSVYTIVSESDYELQLNNVYSPGKVIGGVSYYNFGDNSGRMEYTKGVVGINRVLDVFRVYESKGAVSDELLVRRLKMSEDFYGSYLDNVMMKDGKDAVKVGNILVSFPDILGLVQEKKLLDSIEYEVAEYSEIYEFENSLGKKVREVRAKNKGLMLEAVIKVFGLTLFTVFLRVYFHKRIEAGRLNYFEDGVYIAYNGLNIGMLSGLLMYTLYNVILVYV